MRSLQNLVFWQTVNWETKLEWSFVKKFKVSRQVSFTAWRWRTSAASVQKMDKLCSTTVVSRERQEILGHLLTRRRFRKYFLPFDKADSSFIFKVKQNVSIVSVESTHRATSPWLHDELSSHAMYISGEQQNTFQIHQWRTLYQRTFLPPLPPKKWETAPEMVCISSWCSEWDALEVAKDMSADGRSAETVSEMYGKTEERHGYKQKYFCK